STGTSVSVLFLDRQADNSQIVLVDASALGEMVKDGKNQRTILTRDEEQIIVSAMNNKRPIDNLSVITSPEKIKNRNYSFYAGQYFELKNQRVEITAADFKQQMDLHRTNLEGLFSESRELEIEISKHLSNLWHE